jgi:hypothetical protein
MVGSCWIKLCKRVREKFHPTWSSWKEPKVQVGIISKKFSKICLWKVTSTKTSSQDEEIETRPNGIT